MAYLVLENGRVFEGERIGAKRNSIGELVFTTNMEGYLETLTDPSYYGQIVIHTFPLIGNYGVIKDDFEGKSYLFGYIVRELCDSPSNFRTEESLDEYLKESDIPGIKGIDTRELTMILRREGTMNAYICDEVPSDISFIKEYNVTNAVKSVCTKEKYTVGDINAKYKVALIDFGAKKNIIRCLVKRDCLVTVYPSIFDYKEILNSNFDGVMLSNGPGDPKENVKEIEAIKNIIGKLPIFGICLGHQLTALALGGDTMKLHFGHRGGNQPVKDLKTNRTYITSQNHGYAVISESVKDKGKEIFVNANDFSNEGIEYDRLNCFTVQFHPEACSGPKDTEFLFDKFINMMKENKGDE